ncbi:DUF1697 domain-containing protein [Streptomyces griseiscabiei]|uniref:DUF1697 domain-containing protein n=1 Tax=Streptomyces griseiscabiei TaxID=2993540 RepID=A0ABU4KYN5_9ACTN|nr:DUF1697 domain-containing protein [Streptomyces griseiscabiei]MBZ3904685.1 DUF1697 domain-containing protein [Streptomyces griseiscabiei]MDX2908433.1 DUF1697 domain-containing protein [Streptomyces griseiscabiei]
MTTTYAALLRGINVGGNKKVPMADLRTLLTGLGHTGVATYLQSGNAVFTVEHDETSSAAETPLAAETSLATGITTAIEHRFGFTVDVLVRDHAYLAAVRDDCPFPAAELEGKQLHVTYLSETPDEARFDDIDRPAFLPEEFRIGDRAVYLYAPEGLGRSKLAETLAKPRLLKGLIATSRNWNTVRKLAELTGSGSGAG